VYITKLRCGRQDFSAIDRRNSRIDGFDICWNQAMIAFRQGFF
jgi:hypothetical protein